MSRSFANAKVLSSSIVLNSLSNTLARRGYAAAATESASRGGVVSIGNNMGGTTKTGEEAGAFKVSWVPDPVTGYYKPENIKDTNDVVDLRAALKKKIDN